MPSRGIKPIGGVEIRNGDKLLYILIAATNKGLSWIHEFVSHHLMEKKDFPEVSTPMIFFPDSWDGYVIYPMAAKPVESLLPNERTGIRPADLMRLYGIDLKRYAETFVVLQPVTVQNKTYHDVHRLLRAIHHNIVRTKLQPSMVCDRDETFISPTGLLNKFSQYPFIITNRYKLIDSCHIDIR